MLLLFTYLSQLMRKLRRQSGCPSCPRHLPWLLHLCLLLLTQCSSKFRCDGFTQRELWQRWEQSMWRLMLKLPTWAGFLVHLPVTGSFNEKTPYLPFLVKGPVHSKQTPFSPSPDCSLNFPLTTANWLLFMFFNIKLYFQTDRTGN